MKRPGFKKISKDKGKISTNALDMVDY